MDFKEIVNSRYATKKFDGKTIPQEKIDELLELIRMSASSFGLQPFKVKIVTDFSTKEKLKLASWNQEQITSCSHLMIFCADTDIMKRISEYGELMIKSGVPEEKVDAATIMMKGSMSGKTPEQIITWTQKQCYIALGNGINGAKSLGFDSCPMEGFDAKQYSEILGLPETLIPTVIMPVGYADDKPRPKMRFSKDQLFF